MIERRLRLLLYSGLSVLHDEIHSQQNHPCIASVRLGRLRGRERLDRPKKIDELKKALVALGYKSGGQFTAQALGLKHRSTVWAILNTKHRRGGLANKTVKQLLASKTMPKTVRRVVDQYVREKLAGAYGHTAKEIKQCAAALEEDLGTVSLRGGTMKSYRRLHWPGRRLPPQQSSTR